MCAAAVDGQRYRPEQHQRCPSEVTPDSHRSTLSQPRSKSRVAGLWLVDNFQLDATFKTFDLAQDLAFGFPTAVLLLLTQHRHQVTQDTHAINRAKGRLQDVRVMLVASLDGVI